MVSILRSRKPVSSGHHARPEGPVLVPVVSIDYAFVGKGQHEDELQGSEEGTGQNPLIVLEDDTTKVVTAHMVPHKGVDEHAIGRVVQDIKNLGYKKIIFKINGYINLLVESSINTVIICVCVKK